MPRRTLISVLASFAASIILVSCSATSSESTQTDNWTTYGLNTNEQRFSPLEQINPGTVSDLGLAWSMILPREARSMQGTPLAIDGKLYFTTSLSSVYALDAKSGKLLWHYDPEAGQVRPRVLRTSNQASRGLGYFGGHIIVATTDGRLVSLDAETGRPTWSVNTIEDTESRKVITGAPRVFGNKVIIGNAGADFGTRGYVSTYDVRTGKFLWRFFTVPGDPALGFENEAMRRAAKTWSGEWWRWGGGGTVWNAITYDVRYNRIYLGVGNSSNYNPAQRSPRGGDNLFLSSIVALDAETGEYIWHYQQNPREAWDWKATNDMILADLTIGGMVKPVLMQAAVNGFFYVLDRSNGKLVSADKFEKATWATSVDLKTGRPVESPRIRYENGPTTLYPSQLGAANWQASSFNPNLGLVYIATLRQAGRFWTTPRKGREAKDFAIGSKHYELLLGANFELAKMSKDDGTGGLVAWDPVAKRARWRVKHSTGWNGGTLATASNLVFQGTADGWIKAYDGASGRELWKHYTGQGIVAPPVTYAAGGQQYLTILVGYGGAAPDDPGWRYGKHLPRVLTFKLGGRAVLPESPQPDYTVHPSIEASAIVDEVAAVRGKDLWLRNCAICHVPGGGGPNGPDLRESPVAQSYEALHSVLRDGSLASMGMPQFDELSDAQIRDISMAVKSYAKSAAQGKVERSPRPHL